MNSKQAGITLIELILVMAIGASIFVLGIKQYSKFKYDSDIYAIQRNVDDIFASMGRYYKANCYAMTNPTSITRNLPAGSPAMAGTVSNYGTVNPNNASYPATAPPLIIPIDINGTLINGGFMRGTMTATSKVVNNAAVAGLTNGYYAAFTSGASGNIEITEVAVHLTAAASTNTNAMLALLNAKCVSSISNNKVQPCSVGAIGSSPNAYIVWERMPSAGSNDLNYPYEGVTPIVKQFTRMYRAKNACSY